MERKWDNVQLAGIGGEWSNSTSNITFHNYDHMEKTLSAARTYGVQFQTGEVEAEFEGVPYKFEFRYRDPWKWIVDLLSDPTLADKIHWYPVQKFLIKDGIEVRPFDEPYTRNKRWKIQEILPHVPGLPHCFIPIALWLDKGMVTKHVRKHPIGLRALFLDGKIRNASGNGGGVLIGYMVIPLDPGDPSDRRHTSKAIDWARFKCEIMHKVFTIIFAPLLGPAKHGEALSCGDNIQRVCYPGIPVTSIDGEEACSVSACRAALANFPCPRCLVHQNDLAKICKTFPLRTTETIRNVYADAMTAPTKTESERILQSPGLHATENFFWSLPNSDPYSANSYDLLHSDESGKWGKHLWSLPNDVLKDSGYKGRLTMNRHEECSSVEEFVKYFPNVTTEEYTDGQAFLDILKCILPCIVQLLPPDSSLVHCIRSYQLYRFMIGLECITENQILRLRKYMATYERYCKRVKNDHGKDFSFYKQHACAHVIDDVHDKGVPAGYSTRPGEGFHQEVKEVYEQTSFKNTDPQLARIHENKEAFARIRMAIDEYDAVHSTEGEECEDFVREGSDLHWSLGSPLTWITAEMLQQEFEGQESCDQPPTVKRHRCIRLRYQSCVNWMGETDILRCNPDYHSNPRYDHVLVNQNDNDRDLAVAHLVELLRCRLPDQSTHDIAVVRMLKPSKWVPKTKWAGVRVYDEKKSLDFVMIKYLIRGAHMIPVFNTKKLSMTYRNDLIDGTCFYGSRVHITRQEGVQGWNKAFVSIATMRFKHGSRDFTPTGYQDSSKP
ncbi:hypothetical protein DFH08DRAFT_914503 [Mycena albidolilacea]|uniref:Uncharacterized protein n=1 Tax=Mycena albidolilacea TaxID=1033008 RepID=A0AAD7A261_9AGAR|nr:hypothetical protein DFH08DRAFT_914503 [Mycena albidolilacea]